MPGSIVDKDGAQLDAELNISADGGLPATPQKRQYTDRRKHSTPPSIGNGAQRKSKRLRQIAVSAITFTTDQIISRATKRLLIPWKDSSGVLDMSQGTTIRFEAISDPTSAAVAPTTTIPLAATVAVQNVAIQETDGTTTPTAATAPSTRVQETITSPSLNIELSDHTTSPTNDNPRTKGTTHQETGDNVQTMATNPEDSIQAFISTNPANTIRALNSTNPEHNVQASLVTNQDTNSTYLEDNIQASTMMNPEINIRASDSSNPEAKTISTNVLLRRHQLKEVLELDLRRTCCIETTVQKEISKVVQEFSERYNQCGEEQESPTRHQSKNPVDLLEEVAESAKSKYETAPSISVSYTCCGVAHGIKIGCQCIPKKAHSSVTAARAFGENSWLTSPVHGRSVKSFAVNVTAVAGFQATGNGPIDSEKILGGLGLTGSISFRSKFSKLEIAIGSIEEQITHTLMAAAVHEEVELTLQNDTIQLLKWSEFMTPPEIGACKTVHDTAAVSSGAMKEEAWRLIELAGTRIFQKWENDNDECGILVGITGSMDTGWGGGRKYESNWGNLFCVGAYTRKPLMQDLRNKGCSKCTTMLRKEQNENPASALTVDDMVHEGCTKNHLWSVSSGRMEAESALAICVAMPAKHRIYLAILVADEDSALRAALKHSFKDLDESEDHEFTWPRKTDKKGISRKLKCYGRLPLSIPVPKCLSDLCHRCRCAGGKLHYMKKLGVTVCRLHEADVLRLLVGFKYYCRQNRDKSPNAFVVGAVCIVDHHFDIHTSCDPAWCSRKTMTADALAVNAHRYRSKVEYPILYSQLIVWLNQYINHDNVESILHFFDTNKNECLHECVRQLAPKHKNFHTTKALSARINVAAGVNLAGYYKFWSTVFEYCGIEVTDDMKQNLMAKEKIRDGKKKYRLLSATKRDRKAWRYEKSRKQTACMANAKKTDLDYQSGIGMPGAAAGCRVKKLKTCTHCGGVGHTTKRSSSCGMHHEYMSSKRNTIATLDTFKGGEEETDKLVDKLLDEVFDAAAPVDLDEATGSENFVEDAMNREHSEFLLLQENLEQGMVLPKIGDDVSDEQFEDD